MKPIIINKGAAISDGVLTGLSGRIVGADATENEVTLEVERGTFVTISRDKVYQNSAQVLVGEDTQP
jgi:hypothetical protein